MCSETAPAPVTTPTVQAIGPRPTATDTTATSTSVADAPTMASNRVLRNVTSNDLTLA